MNLKSPVSIFWHRRDLRIEDNAALFRALKGNAPVLPIFIFDQNILAKLEDKTDARVSFIYEQIKRLKQEYAALGTDLKVFYDIPANVFSKIAENLQITSVYINHDYEPYAIERDTVIAEQLKNYGAQLKTYKDQCIFEKDEVLSNSGTPYTVFTPYSRKWKEKLTSYYLKPYPTLKYKENFYKTAAKELLSLDSMGFEQTNIKFPEKSVNTTILKEYGEKRDIPSVLGTSRLSVHLRFGTLSIRQLTSIAKETSEKWLNELIWRDFYMNILHHFPHVGKGQSFRKEYDAIQWRNNELEYEAWCQGNTGYPIVDAGMRELNTTGFMHNRVRMVVASFLTKHLLIDWRLGEAYFAKKLLDFDLSANNGGWQWASGSGCDAAPYFRVFNPRLQTEKFDKELRYIKKWVPEYAQLNYPKPIVDHDFARKRVLEVYQKALKGIE
jgi:deoxyribodipyrimidine photo-lyase